MNYYHANRGPFTFDNVSRAMASLTYLMEDHGVDYGDEKLGIYFRGDGETREFILIISPGRVIEDEMVAEGWRPAVAN